MDISPHLEPDTKNPIIELMELPKKWALQKPLADYSVELVEKLIKDGRIVATKKYNGHRVHVLINSAGSPIIYNRTKKDTLNGFIPNLVEFISSLNIKPDTLLDGEIYIPNKGKVESLDALQSVICCGNEQLGAERETNSQPHIAIFDMLVTSGQNIILQPYKARRQLLPQMSGLMHPVQEVAIKSRSEGLALAHTEGWEGMVLWDLQGPHKLNTNGNTKRGTSYKLKPEFEEDFIAIGYSEGTGGGAGKVGTLTIGKYISGIFVNFGEVGSGLTEAEKLEYMDKTKFPIVVEVKHFGTDIQGRVTLATINKIHRDKTPEEVT